MLARRNAKRIAAGALLFAVTSMLAPAQPRAEEWYCGDPDCPGKECKTTTSCAGLWLLKVCTTVYYFQCPKLDDPGECVLPEEN